MLDISSAKLSKLIVHRVGNKLRDEGITLSEGESDRTESLDHLLLNNYLLSTIKSGELYEFYHESDISLNVVHHFKNIIFHDSSTFIANSKNIAKHLYSSSTHPNIGGGEFLIILFDDVRVQNSSRQALGMFRIEGKSDYLDVRLDRNGLQVVEKVGISLERIQKGAVAVSGSQDVYIVDSLGLKTKYWLESFLKAIPSRTPQVCAKTAGNFLKAISSKLKSPEAALQFHKELQSSVNEGETLSFGALRKMSSSFVDDNGMSEILAGIKSKSGLDMSDAVEIDNKHLTRYTRDVLKKTRITEGVSLVISNQSAKVSSLHVSNTSSGIHAIIDIQMEED